MRREGVVAGVLCVLMAVAFMPGGWAQEDAECFFCHGDPEFQVEREDGSFRRVYIDKEEYEASVHGPMGCIGCHSDVTDSAHDPDLQPVNCGDCHVEMEEYTESPHGKELLSGGSDVSGCSDCHGAHDIRPSGHALSKTHPANQPETCGKCHSDPELARRHMISVMNPSDSYMRSDHAKAIRAGNLDAASCTDCHGSHGLRSAIDHESKVYRRNISSTCGECHPDAERDYKLSIHGRAFEAGIQDAPTCNDCHGEHGVIGSEGAESTVSPRKVVTQTCTRCHDDETIMKKYGIATARQASYMDSYHGMASGAGSDIVASCASCHEGHLVLPDDDPASSVHKDNLPDTCGKCHENAGPNFAMGAVHLMPTDPDQMALGIVRLVYIVLIVSIIGGMVFHNTLSMGRRAMNKFREELSSKGTYRRFSSGMTIGHMILTVSFVALVLSGFALRYPETWWASLIFHGERGLAMRDLVHRGAALVLVGLALWNAFFLVFTRNGRREFGHLMFNFKDLKDVVQNVAYMLGLRKDKPKFDRYGYIEKFEYWGMWWGTLLMIVTGFCMWFVNQFLQYFPKLALDVVALIHFYEAWLALLTITVWHMYYMVFDPETYPMNWSWITGRITLEDMKERHPLEYKREIDPNAELEESEG